MENWRKNNDYGKIKCFFLPPFLLCVFIFFSGFGFLFSFSFLVVSARGVCLCVCRSIRYFPILKLDIIPIFCLLCPLYTKL